MQLTVFENQPIKIDNNVSDSNTISNEQMDNLEKLSIRLKESEKIKRRFFQTINRKSMKFLNYAGAISLGEFQIEILPKIFDTASSRKDPEDAFVSFARMISYTFGLKKIDSEILRLRESDRRGVLEIMIFFFFTSLKKALADGFFNQYEKEIIKRGFIVGKPLFAKQMYEVDQSTLIQEAHIYTVNTELMQYMKSVSSFFATVTKSKRLKEDLYKISKMFVDIDELPIGDLKSMKLIFNRLNVNYKNSYNLSKFILDGLMIHPDPDQSNNGVTILFDMTRVFQDFFEVFLSKNQKRIMPIDFTHKIIPQRSKYSLLIDDNSKSLKPDIRIESTSNSETRTTLMDTKYKSVNSIIHNSLSGVWIGDLYQMYAYSMKYQARDTILVYPSTDVLKETPPSYFEDHRSIRAWGINLTLNKYNWEEILISDLKELVNRLFEDKIT